MDATVARTLDKEELSRATGVGLEVIRKMTSDGTIPERFRVSLGGRELRYVPATVALVAFLVELHAFFGQHSPIPRAIVRRPGVAAKLEQAWQQGAPVQLIVSHSDNIEIQIKRSDCVGRARHQLAQLA